jgi:C4-dicarboxylate-specific signal transduction histidine kinase
LTINECKTYTGGSIAAKVTIFSILFILLSYICIENLDDIFFNPASAQVSVNKNNTTTNTGSNQNNISLITNILANNLENRIQKAGAILEITSKLPQVRNLPYAHLLNQTLNTLHGIPQYADIEKRQLGLSIISNNNDLYEIFFIMPNGNMYFLEPYSIQKTLSKNNYAFRDYFQEAIKGNDTYLGNGLNTAAASGIRTAQIAVPVYSLKDNSTIAGVWASSIDFNVLNKELQSLILTSLGDGTRVVYVDSKGQKIADSDITKSIIPESFSNLNGFKAAISGQTGSTIEKVDNKNMLVAYQPVNAFHNTWVVLSMQPSIPK